MDGAKRIEKLNKLRQAHKHAMSKFGLASPQAKEAQNAIDRFALLIIKDLNAFAFAKEKATTLKKMVADSKENVVLIKEKQFNELLDVLIDEP